MIYKMLDTDKSHGPLLWFFQKLLSILQMVGVVLYCECFFLRTIFFRRSFIRLYPPSLGKAGPFTLDNHIHVKALKMQGFPNN